MKFKWDVLKSSGMSASLTSISGGVIEPHILAPNDNTDITVLCCFQIVLHVSIPFHQPHHKPLEGMAELSMA